LGSVASKECDSGRRLSQELLVLQLLQAAFQGIGGGVIGRRTLAECRDAK
jgi:hypothetical protein